MRLIDADRLKQDILAIMPERSEVLLVIDSQPDIFTLLKKQETEIEQLNRFVNGFSRSAVVPVRCKNCKHRETKYCAFYQKYKGTKYDDWFCADGKRRTD